MQGADCREDAEKDGAEGTPGEMCRSAGLSSLFIAVPFAIGPWLVLRWARAGGGG